MEQVQMIITGATGSIGSEAVRAMAKRGHAVIMACRNVEKGEAVKRRLLEENPLARLQVMQVDMASLKSVNRFVESLKDQGVALSGLFNNAGVMNRSFALTEDGFEQTYYPSDWLTDPRFIGGFLVFIIGMYINIQSDDIIRNLRKEGDSNHYLPKGGMFRYVTSANYFGEFVEWVGFAILTWSWAGAVFALWTFANLCPRAARIYDRYKTEFGDELDTKKVKRIIPFIY